MKEQLITFETAKLAKEKVFQVGCRTSYCEYHNSFEYDGDKAHRESHEKGEVRLDMDFYTVNNYKSIDSSNKHYTIYEAPTQSLLQKWLREVHTINVLLDIESENIPEYRFYVYTNINNCEEVGNKTYNTYEQTLEKGLQKALKLIK